MSLLNPEPSTTWLEKVARINFMLVRGPQTDWPSKIDGRGWHIIKKKYLSI